MMHYDIAIIGAGAVGGAIAREMSKYNLKIVLIEKEHDVSLGASKANSGIVHGGYAGKAGTLKGALCIKGNQMFEALNEQLHFGYRKTGAYMLAFSESDFDVIKAQIENGIKVGESGYEIIDQERLRTKLPYVSEEAIGALYIPTVGVTSPYEYTIALIENAISNGVALKLDFEVEKIQRFDSEYFEILDCKGERLFSKIIINAAGAHSGDIAESASDEPIEIMKRKGQYILLGKDQSYLCDRVIFQTPNKKGKGVLVTTTFHGNLMIGPDAEDIKEDVNTNTSLEGLEMVIKAARKSIPGFNLKRALTTFSGIRAMSPTGDFVIKASPISGLFHVAGIDSPGLTSSPAIAQYLVELIKSKALIDFDLNESFNGERPPIIKVNKPDSKIICRCEGITESEILDSLTRGIPVGSTDAVKRRTRAGMGNCQGNYCGPRVKAILSEHLEVEVHKIKTRTETQAAPIRVEIEEIRKLRV